MPAEVTSKIDTLLELVSIVHGEPVHTVEMAIGLLDRKVAQRLAAEKAWGRRDG